MVKLKSRFASIDFLRGVAIFIMLCLHMVSSILAIDPLLANINNVPLLNILALIILPYLGGLAGLFLMISSVGNMVSMYKHLQRGKSVKDLVIRQVVGGIILLIFAMLTESTIGYIGALGSFFENLDDPSNTAWARMLWRFNTFEAIHAVAWGVILNGITQGILSRNGNWKNTTKLIKIYAVLSVIIICLTQLVWDGVAFIVPGYPFGIDEFGAEVYQPILGQANPLYILVSPFLSMLAAPMEPMFPYLATSYIGSIIGIVISQPREEVPATFPKRMLYVGLLMFIVGSIGVIVVILGVMDTQGFDKAAQLYQLISYHRHWNPDYPHVVVPPFAWIWQYLSLNGFAIIAIMIMLRLVEFRGKAKAFAEKTTFIRRFGFIAFTIYAIQWVFYIVHFLTSLLITGVPYAKLDWGGTFLTMVISILVFHFIMRAWEKARYVGSLEWCIGTIAYNLIPARKESTEERVKWWLKGALNVDEAFYNVEWLDIIEKGEIKHDELKESKLAFKLSLFALCSIIVMPIAFITFGIARNAKKTESENNYNKLAYIVSIIAMVLVIAFFIVGAIISSSMLGLYL